MYVEMRDINKTFGDFQASKDISFGIEKGSLIALLGPSGSGKTTILRMIAGLEFPDSGEILIDGKVVNDLPGSQRGIGFVFQNYALFRYMTVWDNIAFGLTVQKRCKKEIAARVNELIQLVGLEGMEKRFPNQLSGGQRQRVAFARALAPKPQLLLLDEPFAAIDAKVRQELRLWLKDLISQIGVTSIIVTHDQEEALELADQIIVTNHGHIEQIGTPEAIFLDPQSAFMACFVNNSPVIWGDWHFIGFQKTSPDMKAVIRPEFVEAFKPDNRRFLDVLDATEDGVIEKISFRGSFYELCLRVGDVSLTVHRGLSRRQVEIGEHLRVLIYRMCLFTDDHVEIAENQAILGHCISYF